eukprot:TRINITY_DN2711_c0_g1_i5.p2 TRINITY_DN2711_c0_g1~~TRINITY_DN2711_c0_g1_i5.p2  ORF type:complete len:221 (+),score=72.37 TRINITY_DN2711_c0_g1_i5:1031-1693(+)
MSGKMDLTKISFFNHLLNQDNRRYTVVVDRSGSMTEKTGGLFSSTKWSQVSKAVQFIVQAVNSSNDEGMSLYFFSNGLPDVKEGLKSAQQVFDAFASVQPFGASKLGKVLIPVFKKHIELGDNPESVLVITDGLPTDPARLRKTIVDVTNMIKGPQTLSITIIQVGEDGPATKFLEGLKEGLVKEGQRFDIVDIVTGDQLKANQSSLESMVDQLINALKA